MTEERLTTGCLSKKTKYILSAASIIAVLVLVWVLEQNIPPTSQWSMLFTVIKKGAIYSLVVVSMNLLNGFTGLFSLGQAGFMLIGAYAYAIFAIPVEAKESVYQYYEPIIGFSVPEILSNAMGGAGTFGGTMGEYLGVIILMIFAGLITAGIAFLIGLPVLRLKSDYLAIASLGFAEIIRTIFQWDGLGAVTNGSNLLRKFPTFSSSLFPLIVSGLCIAFIVMLINSSYGRAFKAIRDDEIAAEAMGVNLFKHKQLSFVISSFFTGIGGAMLAMFQATVNATPFTSNMTYELLLIVVIGGIGSVTGSVLGSFLFIACSEWWLRFLDEGKFLGMEADFMRPGFRKVVFALIIICIVLFYSKGIMGTREFSWDGLISFFRKLPSRLLNFFKRLPGRIVNFFKGLPGRISGKVKKLSRNTKNSKNNHTKNTDNVKEAR